MQTRSTRSLNGVSCRGDAAPLGGDSHRNAQSPDRQLWLCRTPATGWAAIFAGSSNQPATNGYPSSLVFPVEGGMSFIEQGPFGGVKQSNPDELAASGIARRF